VGAYDVVMTDVEVCTFWVADLDAHAAFLRAGATGEDGRIAAWAERRRAWTTHWREELMTPGAGSPFAP
jgi:hypothetical protein